MPEPRLSIIIPCLNESRIISQMLEYLQATASDAEIIVVDGGSSDDTVNKVRLFSDVILLESKVTSRAYQMNLGAKHAKGDIFLFLHADTFPPANFVDLILKACTGENIAGGSFSLAFDHSHWAFRAIAAITYLNIPWITVGDHGLFFQRSIFEKLNGFPAIPILEDLELQLMARKKGKMIRITHPVTTSPRRFLNNGIFRQIALDAYILVAYFLGVSPKRLARLYSDEPDLAR